MNLAKLTSLTFLSAAALGGGLFATSSSATANATRTVSVTCVETPAAYCEAFKAQLAKELRSSDQIISDENGTSDVSISLVVTDNSRSRIAGHLSWQNQGSKQSMGPEVEVTTQDSALRSDAPDMFATALLKASNLSF